MRKAVFAIAAGLLAMVLTAQSQPASAIPLQIAAFPDDANNPQLVVGNLQFWITGCSITDTSKGWNQASCAGSGLELVAGSSGPTHGEVVIQSATPGGHIFDVTHTPIGSDAYDLSLTLDVATVGLTPRLTSDAIGITGSASPSDAPYVTVGETVEDTTGHNYFAPTAYLGYSPTVTFGPTYYVSIHKDIGDQLGNITGPVTIDQITQNFGVVPEPASIGVLFVGLVALAASRRRIRL